MTNALSAKSTAKDVFSYLLMIVMLYVGVVSFITLLFQYINSSFPDVLDFAMTGAYEAMRGGISALLIVWPVLILMSWLINKDLQGDSGKRDIWVRKWLLYLTLFIASLTVIVDLITLVNIFLSGEITTRFVLKVIVVLAVAVAVFAYYFWELRRDTTKKTKVTKISAIVSSVVILGWIIAGFFLVGSPMEQRAIRMDETRVYDMQSIQSQALQYWIQKEALPATLKDLEDPFSGYQVPVDPLTKNEYTYTIKGELEFELCATFETDHNFSAQGAVSYPREYYSPSQDSTFNLWQHEAGLACFSRVIDPELYDNDETLKGL